MSDHYRTDDPAYAREAALICWDGQCADEWNVAHPEELITLAEWSAYQRNMDEAVEEALAGQMRDEAYKRGYEDGVARGRRVVEDPTRFPIRRADYTTLHNEQRG